MNGTSDERQTYEDSDAWDRPVQGFRFRESGPKNETESARTLCHRMGWRFNSKDEVTEDGGSVIAATIEDAAAAMVDLGWVMRGGAGGWLTNYAPIPHSPTGGWDTSASALAVRARLDSHGRHEGWRSESRR